MKLNAIDAAVKLEDLRLRATSKSVFTLNELISFVQKSPFPLFQRGNLKVSLCKGRFRGIFDPAQRDFDGTVICVYRPQTA